MVIGLGRLECVGQSRCREAFVKLKPASQPAEARDIGAAKHANNPSIADDRQLVERRGGQQFQDVTDVGLWREDRHRRPPHNAGHRRRGPTLARKCARVVDRHHTGEAPRDEHEKLHTTATKRMLQNELFDRQVRIRVGWTRIHQIADAYTAQVFLDA